MEQLSLQKISCQLRGRGLVVLLLSALLVFTPLRSSAQGGTWTWMRGGSLQYDGVQYGFAYGGGNYGTKGIAAPTNEPPARYEACYWTDRDGNFWIFGGTWLPNGARYGLGNDLWKYDIGTNMWTWVNGPNAIAAPNKVGVWGTKGVPSAQNYPPARCYGANCWTDNNGDLWLFGGFGDAGSYNDLWKYHIPTNEWTWVSGSPTPSWTTQEVLGTKGIPSSGNDPGDLIESKSAWVDAANNLWMFGGDSKFYLERNLLWKYDIARGEWTWMSGDVAVNSKGSYGTFRVPGATNRPPARKSYTRWKDRSDDMYLFAGVSDTFVSAYNDVWRYRPSSNEWTWVSGSNKANDAGAYPPEMCRFYKDNYFPPSRLENPSPSSTYTSECARAFWTFGGVKSTAYYRDSTHVFNDLWLFNVDSFSWAWIGGTKTLDHNGVYGKKGVPAPTNMPPGRSGQCMWTDKYNNVWVFGGLNGDAGGNSSMNDLWRFTPDSNCFDLALLGDQLVAPYIRACSHDTVVMKIGKHATVHCQPGEGIAFNADSSVITFFPDVTTAYTVIVTGGSCHPADTVRFTVPRSSVRAAFDVSPKVATSNAPFFQLTNRSSGAQSYQWFQQGVFATGQASPTLKAVDTGRCCFMLVAADSLGCTDTATDCVDVLAIHPLIYVPSAFSPNGDDKNDILRPIGKDVRIISFSVYNRYGERVFVSYDGSGWNGTYHGKGCDVGTYFYQLQYLPLGAEGSSTMKGDVTLVR